MDEAMSENHGMSTQEATAKICPVMPGLGWYVAANSGGELFRSNTIQITSSGPSYCRAEHCAMWTWVAGSRERGYCGLRGHVVIP